MICDRVGLEIPAIEVRFEHLNVDAKAYVGGRALPTIFNFSANILEVTDLSVQHYITNTVSCGVLLDSCGEFLCNTYLSNGRFNSVYV